MFSYCLFNSSHIENLLGSGKTLVALTNCILSETCKGQTTFVSIVSTALTQLKCRGDVSRNSSFGFDPAAVREGIVYLPPTRSIIMICQVCEEWGIPYVSLDGMDTETIFSTITAMETPPRVILSTVSRVSQEAVQKQIRRLPIRTICLDEVQVEIYMEIVTLNCNSIT